MTVDRTRGDEREARLEPLTEEYGLRNQQRRMRNVLPRRAVAFAPTKAHRPFVHIDMRDHARVRGSGARAPQRSHACLRAIFIPR